MLDADGQHDPAEIPAFLQAYTALGADLIIGERTFRQMPFPRNVSNTIGRWLFSWALGQPVRDNQSGYRLLSRRMMEATLSSREQGFEFEVEMIVTCVQRGYTLTGVPIRTIYAGEKSHIKPLPQTVHFLRVVWQTWRAMRRSRRAGGASRWEALLLLPLFALAGALLILWGGTGTDAVGSPPPTYPTPAPIAFTPPTPLPPTPQPTLPAPEEIIGLPAPDFALPLMSGEVIRLGDLGGKTVFLNFWATWCVPCQNEMPLLQRLQDELEEFVRVIAVTDPHLGQTERQVREFLSRYSITFPVALVEDETVYRYFDVAQIPVTYILDDKGVIRFRHIGELTAADINRYLGQIEPGAIFTGSQ
jgi:thiol-disulfide isomerase/thioredoxin